MKKFKKFFKEIILPVIILISIFIAIVLFIAYPIKGWYIEVPGTANSLSEMITVNGKKDKQSGEFRLTSVGIMKATPLLTLKAIVSPVDTLTKQEDLMGSANQQQYQLLQSYYMQTSENTAKMMALKLADKPYELKYDGVYVMSIDKKSSFKKKLKVGDLIKQVDNQSFNSADEMINYIGSKNYGDKVTVKFESDGKVREVTGKLKKFKDIYHPALGIGLVTKTSIKSNEKIKFNVGDIGGPSAGMMFTLETYEQLTGKDLRKGRDIAGTGEILPDGSIGRIGGIDKKVVAASKAGATIFLAPDDEIPAEVKKKYPDLQSNYEEAKEAAKKNHLDIKVVPVKNITDAVKYLEETGNSKNKA